MSSGLKSKMKETGTTYELNADMTESSAWLLNVKTLQFEYAAITISGISGYTEAELYGSHIKDLVTRDSYETAKSILAEAMLRYRNGEVPIFRFSLEMFHKEGHTIWVEVIARLMRDSHGNLRVFAATIPFKDARPKGLTADELFENLSVVMMENKSLKDEMSRSKRLLPVCDGCNRVQDEQGRWWPIDAYLNRHDGEQAPRGLCGECEQQVLNQD